MPTEIDLHGLYVKEAITYTDNSIAEHARGEIMRFALSSVRIDSPLLERRAIDRSVVFA